MRKVSDMAAKAFLADDTMATRNNTSVRDGELRLHGHVVAKRIGGLTAVSLAGWNTVTTRDRVNAVLIRLGCDYRIAQRDGLPVLVNRMGRKLGGLTPHYVYTTADLANKAAFGDAVI